MERICILHYPSKIYYIAVMVVEVIKVRIKSHLNCIACDFWVFIFVQQKDESQSKKDKLQGMTMTFTSPIEWFVYRNLEICENEIENSVKKLHYILRFGYNASFVLRKAKFKLSPGKSRVLDKRVMKIRGLWSSH